MTIDVAIACPTCTDAALAKGFPFITFDLSYLTGRAPCPNLWLAGSLTPDRRFQAVFDMLLIELVRWRHICVRVLCRAEGGGWLNVRLVRDWERLLVGGCPLGQRREFTIRYARMMRHRQGELIPLVCRMRGTRLTTHAHPAL